MMKAYLAPVALGVLLVTPTLQAASVSSRVEVLERRMDVVTDLTLRVENLQQENNMLRGEIDVLKHEIETLKNQQREMYLDIERRFGKQRSSNEQMSRPPLQAPVMTMQPPPAVAPATGQSEQDSYRAAYRELIERKNSPGAIKAFKEHLQRFPGGDYADNAQFWLGEAYYAGNALDSAMQEFQRLVETYSTSPKVPDALYKVGHIRTLKGEPDKARSIFEGLVTHYPDSAAARLAQSRLERLAAN